MPSSASPPQLLRRADVLAATKISKSKLYADIADGLFPAPIKWGRASYFLASEVTAWINQRIAERDARASCKRNEKT